MLAYWKTMSDDGETVTLRRFDGAHRVTMTTERGLQGLVVDVETTGLNHELDAVTEIAALPFEFLPASGEIVHLGPMYTGLQDPGRPMTPEIVKLTGLTDDMLRGQRIDWRRVSGNALVGVDGPRRFEAIEKTISVTTTEKETP